MSDYGISDLISNAMDEKPLDFKQAFDSLVNDRIATAVYDKKVEVASDMFNDTEEESDPTDDEDQDDQEDDADQEDQEEQEEQEEE